MAFLFPNYFPFCIYEGEGDIGDGTEYPIGMTLEDAMTLYWKAKTFRIIETWNTINPDTGSFVTGSTNTILTPNGNFNTMTDVSCWPNIESNGRSGTFSVTLPSATNPGPYSFQDYIHLWLFGNVGVVHRNGLYYPQILFFREGGYYQYIEWASFFGGVSQGQYPATITINGNQYSFNIYDNALVGNYNNTSTQITIDSERTAS